MIPTDRMAAVERALDAVAGTSTPDSISQIHVGLSSALVYRVSVGDQTFVLRVITRMDEHSDPTQHFLTMRAASDAGIAPAVLYASPQDRISIIEFVRHEPMAQSRAVAPLAQVVRKIHQLDRGPTKLNYFQTMGGMVTHIASACFASDADRDEALRAFERALTACSGCSDEWVLCHNDLKPDNILWDNGTPRVIDWEAAFPNDPFVDLAVIANFVADGADASRVLLNEYFGGPPPEMQVSRFLLVQQVMHMIYGSMFSSLAIRSGATGSSQPESDFEKFHARLWRGEIDLMDGPSQWEYAQVHLHRFLQNLDAPEFVEALAELS